jgi:hypothetical protein
MNIHFDTTYSRIIQRLTFIRFVIIFIITVSLQIIVQLFAPLIDATCWENNKKKSLYNGSKFFMEKLQTLLN